MNVKHINSRPVRMIGVGLIAGAVAVTASACGGSSSGATAAPKAANAPKTVNIALTGKIDTDKGPAGSFTSKEHWPALSPSDITISKGDTIVLTIKEYDDAPTALPDGSPYNAVAGGTETVNGAAVTNVSNADIAHTFSIPELGINAPLPKAADGGVATIVFTFTANKAGSYVWRCFTPCGGDPKGMGGSMATKGWMQGHVTVA
jgi:hypothetical protein